MSGTRRRGQYTQEHVVSLFNRHIVKTGVRIPDIHQVSIVQNDDSGDQEVEEQLVLYDKRIQVDEVRILKNYIKHDHPFLTKLHLNHNKVRPEGAKILSSLLENDASALQELFLNRNEIGNPGVISLAEALKTNTHLYQLKIAENYVKDEGAQEVAEMMKVNRTLRGLEFDGNRYTETGTSMLADALNHNEGLKLFQVGESRNIKDRLTFVRMMIQTEKERERTSAVLVFTKDKNNDIIDMILAEWRLCKKEGKALVDIPREKLEKFKKFNKLQEAEFMALEEEIRDFLTDVREKGVKNLRQAKILVMGRAGAGKTSLVRSLITGRSRLTGDGPDRATQSVEISKYAAGLAEKDVHGNERNQKNVKATFWDFGGQEEYYMTHSFFVSPRCVVLICINAAEFYLKKEDEDTYMYQIQYFIDSMQAHAPGAKFMIVGTHCDQLTRNQMTELEEMIKTKFDEVEMMTKDKIEMEIKVLEGGRERSEANMNLNLNLPVDENEDDPFGNTDSMNFRRGAITKFNNGNAKPNRASRHGEILKAHPLTGPGSVQLAELDIDAANSNANSKSLVSEDFSSRKMARRNLSKSLLKKSTKQTLFESPGMTIVDGFDVECDKTKSFNSKKNASINSMGSRNSKLGKWNKTFAFDGRRKADMSPTEKLKEEKLAALQKRLEDRPRLMEVFFTSASIEYLGMEAFKRELDRILTNEKDNDVSVQLPKNYAKLYENISGENMVLKNAKISEGSKPKEASGNTLRRGFMKRRSKLSRTVVEEPVHGGTMKRNSKGIGGFFQQKGKVSPIIEIAELYEAFVSMNSLSTKGKMKNATGMTLRRKKTFQIKKLFASVEELHRALRTLHEIGYILWFEENEMLRDIVFVDPSWVVNMIRTVIKHNMFGNGEGSLETLEKPDSVTSEEFLLMKDRLKQTAILDSRLLFQFDVWKDCSDMEKFHMLRLMQSFDLLCESPRQIASDPIPKYFVPLYLKSIFSQGFGEDNQRRMKELEQEAVANITTVPKFARSLFTPDQGMTQSQKIAVVPQKSAFFENMASVIRPQNIQWRYEFENFFPEGLFLRLLVRCNSFFSFHEKYTPTESFVVGKSSLGVTILIQAEKKKFNLAGALILTAIQEQVVDSESFNFNMTDIWQVFSIFAFEIEDLLQSFPGLETNVLVSVVHEGLGKVIIKRRQLEMEELIHNGNPSKEHKTVRVNLGTEKVALYHLIPPLYILPRDKTTLPEQASLNVISPELVRLSKFARIEYALMSVDAQIGEDLSGKQERIMLLHTTLVDCLDRMLKLLCAAVAPTEKVFVRSFEEALKFLKEQNVEDIIQVETKILQMKESEKAAFVKGQRISPGELKHASTLCRRLFNLLEIKLVLKKQPQAKKKNFLNF